MPGKWSLSARSRLGLTPAYELTLFLTVAVALGSLLLTGEIHPVHTLIVIAAMTAAIAFPARLRSLPAGWWDLLIILALVIGLATALYPPRRFESYFHGLVYFLIYALIVRYVTRRTPADDLLLLLLALLLIAAATILTASISFLGILLTFLVLIVSSVMLLCLRSETAALAAHTEALQSQAEGQAAMIARDAGNIPLAAAPPGLTPPALPVTIPAGFFGLPIASTLGIFLIGLVLFFVIPRLGSGLFGFKLRAQARVTGFSDAVELGSVGVTLKSNALVMRVRMAGAPVAGPFFFRGNALDNYDGAVWRDTLGPSLIHHALLEPVVQLSKALPPDEKSVRQDVILEPIESNVLFGLPRLQAFSTPFRNRALLEYANDYIAFSPTDAILDRVTYTVWSQPAPKGPKDCEAASRGLAEELEPRVEQHYLQLPEGSAAIVQLAQKVAGRESAICGKVYRLQAYLQTNFTYELDTPSDQAPDPIADFLFRSRRGYCEHFATSLALMLRGLGVPCRVAAGYLSGDYNPIENYYRVRESNAHTWVEVYLPDGEWLLVNPTPAAEVRELPPWLKYLQNVFDSIRYRWDRYVIDLSLGEQYSLLLKVREQGAGATRVLSRLPAQAAGFLKFRPAKWLLLLLPVAGLVGWLLWTRRRAAGRARASRPPGFSELCREYRRLLQSLEKIGLRRATSETARELSTRIAAARLPFAAAFREATERYLEVRFGQSPKTAAARRAIQRAQGSIPAGRGWRMSGRFANPS